MNKDVISDAIVLAIGLRVVIVACKRILYSDTVPLHNSHLLSVLIEVRGVHANLNTTR